MHRKILPAVGLLTIFTGVAHAEGPVIRGLDLGNLTIPILVAILAVTFITVISLFLRNYIKVPPNQAAVISGRKHKLSSGETVGYRVVHGGATFRLPVVEQVDYLSLEVMNFQVNTDGAITTEGVQLSVRTIANVKIGSDDGSLRSAAERFLGKNSKEIQSIISQTLEAHLRSICGKLTVEQINNDRQRFAQMMVTEAMEDLKKLGIIIDAWAVLHIEDAHGYLQSLGKKRIAEVMRDAQIGEAQAKRDSDIQTAEAQSEALKKSTDAAQQGAVEQNKNLVLVAEAERELAVKKARNAALVATEQARTEQAGPLAKAETQKAVLVAETEAQRAKVEAEIRLQETLANRAEAELRATVIKQAEAGRQKQIIEAEGARQAAVIKAESEKSATTLTAEASKLKIIADGEANASRIRALGNAEAEASRAKYLATAEGEAAVIRQKGNAEAEVRKSALLAEAEGMFKKAEAFQKLDQAGRFMSVLERAPEIIEALGKAGAQITVPAFQAIGAGLGNIERLSIVDTGNGDGQSAVSRLASTAPEIFFGLGQKLKELGLGNVLTSLGLPLNDLNINPAATTSPALPPKEASPATPADTAVTKQG